MCHFFPHVYLTQKCIFLSFVTYLKVHCTQSVIVFSAKVAVFKSLLCALYVVCFRESNKMSVEKRPVKTAKVPKLKITLSNISIV